MSTARDELHEWADRHDEWARAQVNGIPAEQREWDHAERHGDTP